MSQIYKDSDFKDFINEKFLCIDFAGQTTQFFVNANIEKVPNSRIEVIVYPCMLATGCIRDDAKLKHIKLIAGKTSTTFSPENKKKPLGKFVDIDDVYSLDTFQTLEVINVMKTVEIQDDTIDFMGGKKVFEYIDYDKTTATRRTRDKTNENADCVLDALDDEIPACEPYFTFQIRSGGLTTKINREYKKVVNTLSDIGGFFDLAALIATSLICCCTSRSFGTLVKKGIMGKSSKDYTSNVKGSTAKEIDGYMDDALDETQDTIEALKAIGTVKILENLFFKKHHKTLLPLIMVL